jgi:hypothetical protein
VVEVHSVCALLRSYAFSREGLMRFVAVSLVAAKLNDRRFYALAKELVGNAVGDIGINGRDAVVCRLAPAVGTN